MSRRLQSKSANKSLQATRDGGLSSAIAEDVINPACLSSGRSAKKAHYKMSLWRNSPFPIRIAAALIVLQPAWFVIYMIVRPMPPLDAKMTILLVGMAAIHIAVSVMILAGFKFVRWIWIVWSVLKLMSGVYSIAKFHYSAPVLDGLSLYGGQAISLCILVLLLLPSSRHHCSGEKAPNQSPLRMPVSGTPAADAPVAPPPGIAGL